MPRFDQMNEGKYLKKEDFPQPALLTIAGFKRENVARDDEPQEMKWVVSFQEIDRGLALNVINTQLLKTATGRDSSEESVGCKVVLYNEPNVSMGGKLVGGIRIRAPRNLPGPAPVPAPVQVPVYNSAPIVRGPAAEGGVSDDSVPF